MINKIVAVTGALFTRPNFTVCCSVVPWQKIFISLIFFFFFFFGGRSLFCHLSLQVSCAKEDNDR